MKPQLTKSTATFRGLAERLWRRLPDKVALKSPGLAVMLRDGDWTLALPPLAVVLPPLAIVAGFWAAIKQPEALWTYDLQPAYIIAVAGALGCALGLWASVGYLIGLFGFWTRPRDGRTLSELNLGASGSFRQLAQDHGIVFAFTHTYAGLLVACVVLLELAVLIPVGVAGCRAAFMKIPWRNDRVRTTVGGVLASFAAVVVSFQWTRGAPMMIRPYWSFAGSYPDYFAFRPLTKESSTIVLAFGLAAVAREALVVLLPPPSPGTPVSVAPHRLWWGFGIPIQALLLSVLASGMFNSVAQAAAFAVITAIALVLRRVVLPRSPGFARRINAVPLVLRIAAVAGVGVVASLVRVLPAYRSGTQSFTSFVESILVTIVAASILLVAQKPEPWLPRSKR